MYLYMYVLMQADETIHAIFPMRFRDDTDLAIATSFFQVGTVCLHALHPSLLFNPARALVCMHVCSKGARSSRG